jgi:CheY-like chemotaxis protein
LKAAPSTSDVPILGVTAHAMKVDEERILAAGCDGYISKPIDTRTLPGFVKNCLEKGVVRSRQSRLMQKRTTR